MFYSDKIFVSSFTVLTTEGMMRRYLVRCPAAELHMEVDNFHQAIEMVRVMRTWL